LEAEVTLRYDDTRRAQAVAKAISPDNIRTPKGMTVKTSNSRKTVRTQINFEGAFSTFIATIDDLLFSVSTAEKTLQTLEKVRRTEGCPRTPSLHSVGEKRKNL
jgi:hypothetical protein